MREVSANILAAIKNNSTRIVAKAKIDPSRTFFGSLTDDDPYDGGDYAAVTDDPWGQCMLYSPTYGKAYTFVIDSTSGKIYGMEQGNNTKNDMSLTADKDTKPTAWCLGNGFAYLWYWSDVPLLTRVLVDLSDFSTSGEITIPVGSLPTVWTVTAGSPHALSETQLILTYQTSIGGIGVGYYEEGQSWKHWNQRFLSPGGITATDWTIYSTAVIFDSSVFIYITDMHQGWVRGVNFNPYKNLWSDSFEAMPADLSRFCIFNAVNQGGYIHVSGQFHRTEDWANAKVYSLIVRSLDGFTFSWDRFTLLSTLGFQFQIACKTSAGSSYIYASDRNSVGVTEASWFFVSTPNSSVLLEPPNDLINVTINSSSSATLDIKAFDEVFYDEEAIANNNRVILYLGYEITDGEYEYVKYQTYIIAKRTVGHSDKNRSLVLQLEDMATWKTSQIAFPFYAEILGKISFKDDANIQDLTYPVNTVSPYMPSFLLIDFWQNTKWDGDNVITTGNQIKFRSGEGGCAYKEVSNDQGDDDKLKFRTVQLDEYHLIDKYPTIRAAGTCTAKLFGWDTSAIQDLENQEGTYPDRPNNTWKCYIITADPDNIDDLIVTTGSLVSTYDEFPQYYPDNEVGSYPIEWSFSGLDEDDVILYFGFSFENDVEGYSTLCPERLEVSGIDFVYNGASSSQAWETSNPDKDIYEREFLKTPDTGSPSILFTMRPYSAFNFRVNADFIYSPGSDPISVGRTCWGVVGLAEDGKDYIVARFHKQRSQVELVLVRSNQETVFDSYGIATVEGVMLDHRDGRLRVWYRESTTTWIGPIIDYHYDEVTYGRIATSNIQIMHIGIYTAVAPPGFLIPSFQMNKSDGLGILASSDDSVLDAFPDSGRFGINGQIYEYTDKTPRTDDYSGPFQGRRRTQDYWKTYRENGYTYTGHGVEISWWNPDRVPNDFTGLLLAADRGRTWLITQTDWQVYDQTAGVRTLLPNRSRFYCPSLEGKSPVTHDERVNLVPGLLGITPVGDTEPGYHLYGAWCSLWGTDEIWIKNIETNTVARDATVKDMVSMLCKSASVEAVFPGDALIDNMNVTATGQELITEDPFLPGGFDVNFIIPAIDSGDWIALYADGLYIGDPVLTELIDIGIKNNNGTLQIFSKPQDATEDDEYIDTDFNPSLSYEVRVLFHGVFCSVYLDNIWAATFAYAKEDDACPACAEKILTWPDQQVKLYLYSNTTGYTVTDILVTELFDWREAIYVESETNAASALGSVIQERPIENSPTVEGGVAFSYFLVRDYIEYLPTDAKNLITKHAAGKGTISGAGSDAIVIYTDVEFVEFSKFADTEGFLTRVLKLSNLDTGARKTAIIMLKKAWEHQFSHDVSMMPDVRFQVGDRFVYAYRLAGTGRYEQYSCIVEDLNIRLSEGSYEMGIDGYRSTSQDKRSSLSSYTEGVVP